MTNIVCLGWGSLIWDPRDLPIQSCWLKDGPLVPIEFARESQNRRITLVVLHTARSVRSLWALMDGEDVEEMKECLRVREGRTKRQYVGSWNFGEPSPADIRGLDEWARCRNIDYVIWTALPTKRGSESNRVPSEEYVVEHLRKLRGRERDEAERYVRQAPRQIDTAYRRRIEAEFGWYPIGTDIA